MKNLFLMLFCGIACTLTFTSCSDDDTGGGDPDPDNTVAGYIYTTTNGESTNQVIRFDRMDDGSLENETAYTTNSLGGANVSAGGDARGDFDSQGAIKIIGDYLLTVNAGGNDVSVFSLDRTNGELSLESNTGSGGTRPVSITETPINGSPNQYWVVVGNQWNNPNIQKDPPNIQRFPNDAFFMQDLTQPDATDAERNIQLFRFNATDGSLNPVSQLDTYVRENGGPVCVTFSNDGTKLAVGTWGITHFMAEDPLLSEQHPSRVYIYDFNNGAVSNKRFFEEEGIAGTIGLDWNPNNSNTLYATNFNTTVAKTDNSLTVLQDTGSDVTKINNSTTGEEDDLDEACWTAVSPTGDRLYVASFTGNVITPFTLDGSGSVTGKLPFEAREDNAPPADSKDLYITSDNKYLYNLGAFQSYSINIFDVTANGVDYDEQVVLETTQGSIGQPGAFNFLGLVGFDVEQ